MSTPIGGRSIPASKLTPAQRVLVEAVNELNGNARNPAERAVRLSELVAAGLIMQNQNGLVRAGQTIQNVLTRIGETDGRMDLVTRGFNALRSSVEDINGLLTAQTEDLNILRTNMQFFTGEGENLRRLIDATSTATRSLLSRIESGENYLSVLSREQTNLQANVSVSEGTLSFLNNEVVVNAEANQLLEARVTIAEDEIDAQAQFITDLQAAVNVLPRVFLQTTEPNAVTQGPFIIGDMWLDSDDGNKVYVWNGSAWSESADVTGATIYAQTTAPAGAGLNIGDLWFDTDNNFRMYRWDGAAWVDVTNPVIDATASAVSALESRVTLAEGLITSHSGLITTLNNSVFHPTTGLSTRASSSVVSALDSRVTAAEGQLVSQASSITTLSASIGGGSNMLPNAGFETDTSGWASGDGNFQPTIAADSGTGISGDPNHYLPLGVMSLRQNRPGVVAGGTFGQSFPTAGIAVTVGKWYIASAWVNVWRCQAQLYIAWYNASDTWIGENYVAQADTSLVNPTFANTPRIHIKAQAPAGAVYARVLLRMVGTGGADAYIWWLRPMLEEVPAAKSIPSEWQLGAAALDSKYASITQAMDVRVTGTEQAGYNVNMVPNSELLAGSNLWNTYIAGGWSQGTINLAGPDWHPPGINAYGSQYPGTPAVGALVNLTAPHAPVTAGHTYIASTYAAAYRANNQIFIEWKNSAGSVIAYSGGGAVGASSGGTSLDGWTRLSVQATAPAGATSAAVLVQFTATGEYGPYAWMLRPMLEEKRATQTQPSPWNSGGAEMRAAYTLRMDVNGHVSGWNFTNDGTNGDFTLAADKFSIVAPGGGARTEYSGGNWRIYDAAGTLRVRLGVW